LPFFQQYALLKPYRIHSKSQEQQGAEHLDTARDASTLANLYEAQGKYEQAQPLYQLALTINEQQLGPEHPTTQRIRENSSALLRTMGCDAEE